MPFSLIVSYNDIFGSRTFPLISEERKKADQLPGNSFGNCRGWACDIVVLIVAVQRFYACCLSPPKRIEDYFSLVSYYICSHKASFSVYGFIDMFCLVTWLIEIKYDRKTDVNDN